MFLVIFQFFLGQISMKLAIKSVNVMFSGLEGGLLIMRGIILAKSGHSKFHSLNLAFLVEKKTKNRNLFGNNTAI